MIDIPLNKALVAVEVKKLSCPTCFLYGTCVDDIVCGGIDRKDGKNVIFKLVDLPEEGNNGTA